MIPEDRLIHLAGDVMTEYAAGHRGGPALGAFLDAYYVRITEHQAEGTPFDAACARTQDEAVAAVKVAAGRSRLPSDFLDAFTGGLESALARSWPAVSDAEGSEVVLSREQAETVREAAPWSD